MQISVGISVLAFLLFLLLHPIAFRITGTKYRFTLMSCLVLVLTIITFGVSLSMPTVKALDELLPISVYGILAWSVFGFLWLGYLLFYFLVERGVSVRVLAEMASNGGWLEEKAIKDLYSFDDVVSRRIDDMVAVRMLHREPAKHPGSGEDTYTNSSLGNKIGMAAAVSKKILQLGDGG